jgi:hypothetical protein
MATALFSRPAVAPRSERRYGMSVRMKAFLVLLGALGLAAMNGSLPWGP